MEVLGAHRTSVPILAGRTALVVNSRTGQPKDKEVTKSLCKYGDPADIPLKIPEETVEQPGCVDDCGGGKRPGSGSSLGAAAAGWKLTLTLGGAALLLLG